MTSAGVTQGTTVPRCQRGFREFESPLPHQNCADPIHVVPPLTATCLCGTLTLPGDFLR
jgi:hypothetical protein